MTAEDILILCKFLDDKGQPKGRPYTYLFKKTNPDEKIPLYVQTADGSKLVVLPEVVDPESVKAFADKLKYVTAYVEQANEGE